ncbi:MAG TPA: indole-3-glycerol phosphate synthase TrpC [Chitinophagaceae bacterium]|nr:indole-3-glycerol phosphate synthase TrpC [Chitinophagaceae bacterium]
MNILEEIIAHKRKEVEKQKVSMRAGQLEKFGFFNEPSLSLKAALGDKNKSGIIAEFKRQSPSKGIINATADVFAVTAGYTAAGASGLSILTDAHFFGGSIDDLIKARINRIPLLRKDFIIDEYQLIEAKAIGADVVLLIAACLSAGEVQRLAARSKQLGMEVLLEIHDEQEMEHICDEVDLIGVNNRNLKTFSVDLEQSVRLAEKIGAGKPRIAESGIHDPADIRHLQQHGFNGFLIGERFMREADPCAALRAFVEKLRTI